MLFGLWSLGVAGLGNGSASLPAGIAAFAVAVGLVVYDSWFLQQDEDAAMNRLACESSTIALCA